MRWPGSPWPRALAQPVEFCPRALLCTKPRAPPPPPARAWAGRHHPGVVGEPAAGCIQSVPPVGGWGRLGASSCPQIRRWDRRRCCWRVSGFWATGRTRNPLGFVRWVVCIAHQTPKRVIAIRFALYMHYARPHTAHCAAGVRRVRSRAVSGFWFLGIGAACEGFTH
jgi:hypothetical protein